MPARRSEHDQALELRLINWARWSRGVLPECELVRLDRRRGFAPDEIDAMTIDGAITVMRIRRPIYAQVVQLRYLRRWSDLSTAKELRRSETDIKGIVRRMFSWLDGHLHAIECREAS